MSMCVQPKAAVQSVRMRLLSQVLADSAEALQPNAPGRTRAVPGHGSLRDGSLR